MFSLKRRHRTTGYFILVMLKEKMRKVITIFNRKQLVITYDMTAQAKIRDILSANNIDYSINFVKGLCTAQPEYKIYVCKKDYEQACYLIKDVFK